MPHAPTSFEYYATHPTPESVARLLHADLLRLQPASEPDLGRLVNDLAVTHLASHSASLPQASGLLRRWLEHLAHVLSTDERYGGDDGNPPVRFWVGGRREWLVLGVDRAAYPSADWGGRTAFGLAVVWMSAPGSYAMRITGEDYARSLAERATRSGTWR